MKHYRVVYEVKVEMPLEDDRSDKEIEKEVELAARNFLRGGATLEPMRIEHYKTSEKKKSNNSLIKEKVL